ncbi:MAG: HAD-IA family hydrolase [Alphaproteobacteria bacterium]|nr:HAD-IA family hydrolase [Alphaproteobacteria bacterium]
MSRSGLRALLLDLDGTLADSLGIMRTVYDHFMDSCGLAGITEEFEKLNGPPLDEVVRILKETHRLDAPLDELRARYHALADGVYMDVPPASGALELLQAAKARGWTTGVVTSNTEIRTRAWLARAGLDALIDVIVGGDSVPHGKPAPDPYLRALEKTGCQADHALAVEDSPQGAAAALAAGIPTLALIHNPKHPQAWPKDVVLVKSLAEVRARIENGA